MFVCSADHKQDLQPSQTVDAQPASKCYDYIKINTYVKTGNTSTDDGVFADDT